MFLFHAISIPPLFFITSAYIIGIVISHCTISLHIAVLSGIIGTTTITLVLWWHQHRWHAMYGLYALSICIGFGNYWRHQQTDLLSRQALAKAPVEMYGIITTITSTQKSRLPYCITICVEKCIRNNHLITLLHKKYIIVYARCIHKLDVDDLLVIPQAHLPLCAESATTYERKEGITASLFLEPHQYFVVKKPGSYRRWLFNQRKTLAQRITATMSSATSSLYQLLFTGNKAVDTNYKKILYDRCKKWGVSHYLARSGLHMVLFIFFLEFVLRLMHLPFLIKNILLIGISSGYLLLTWPSISFFRAFWTYVMYKVYAITATPILAIQLFSAICLVTLIYNPYYLFCLDFQLSFILSGVLIWLHGLTVARKKYSPKY